MKPLSLLPGERVDLSLKPHPVAFLDLYGVWLLFGALAAMVLILHEHLGGAIADRPVLHFLNDALSRPRAVTLIDAVLFTFLGSLVFAGIAFARTNSSWILAPLMSGAVMITLTLVTELARVTVLLLPVAVALAAVSQLEFYRKAHTFYVTNKRIVFHRQYPLAPYMLTDGYYPHITNLTVRYTLVERLFSAGTVIPIMSSGMNLGSEVVTVAGHILLFTFGASREKRLPRALPFLCFYAVKRPEEVSARVTAYVTGGPTVESDARGTPE